MTCALPTTEMVIRDGQPVWLVQGDGISVEHPSGQVAARMFREICESRGPLPQDPGEQPRRGPSECDEPGV